ncbi:unnamed protein product [Rotaria magnacalcarata]|uniref:Uncharacterized protein n=1 Tax=Rotaria magnacalcarata TaxID=392030 RepID=A0A814RQG6_9BILA|nr:unnamed protein product [Rotaria magnacalcarata]CAF1617772.1 unnamed protein product [Rotaria magnacalcarata]CAF2044999.1 unnamed protein product [Rotaria magnacalcarata]CAF2056393.1 unnamed protein product [Rotaria magnacalcarata]CAF2088659.1 unnamed protein product [Rotaria magnacalcarata]
MSHNQTLNYSSPAGIAASVIAVISSICCCCGLLVIVVCIIKHISRPSQITPNYPVQYPYPPYPNTVSNNLPPPYVTTNPPDYYSVTPLNPEFIKIETA